MNFPAEIQSEFERAAQAREKGNEGQARVCARRAAGIAIREYYARRGIQPRSSSAYDLQNALKDEKNIPDEMLKITEHLTLRVNEEFKLPINADLVEEAKKLCEWILAHPSS